MECISFVFLQFYIHFSDVFGSIFFVCFKHKTCIFTPETTEHTADTYKHSSSTWTGDKKLQRLNKRIFDQTL